MPGTPERPLVTFAVFACNQEKFVREAVEAAFAQTYSPLEIILSDDCSDDRTFAIIQEMAAAYKGPHEIRLNRNAVRRSIGGHFNTVVGMARGELIVVQAADDASLPQRTELSWQAWENSGRRATSLHTDFIQIDVDGNEIEPIYRNEEHYEKGQVVKQEVVPADYVRTLKPILFGCTHAFTKSLFNIFGNLPDHITHEDDVIGFRSVLMKGLCYINERLVKYRLHGANMYLRDSKGATDIQTLQQKENRFRRDFRNRETMYDAFVLDMGTARRKELISEDVHKSAHAEAERLRNQFFLMGKFMESGTLERIQIYRKLLELGIGAQDRSFFKTRLIPQGLLLRLRALRNRLR